MTTSVLVAVLLISPAGKFGPAWFLARPYTPPENIEEGLYEVMRGRTGCSCYSIQWRPAVHNKNIRPEVDYRHLSVQVAPAWWDSTDEKRQDDWLWSIWEEWHKLGGMSADFYYGVPFEMENREFAPFTPLPPRARIKHGKWVTSVRATPLASALGF